jgi:hypothetical protein
MQMKGNRVLRTVESLFKVLLVRKSDISMIESQFRPGSGSLGLAKVSVDAAALEEPDGAHKSV